MRNLAAELEELQFRMDVFEKNLEQMRLAINTLAEMQSPPVKNIPRGQVLLAEARQRMQSRQK